MKLGPVTKFDKKNTKPSKEFDDDFIPTNYDVILIFLVNAWFKKIQTSDSRLMVYDS